MNLDAPCLSLTMQCPGTAATLTLDMDCLHSLRQALQAFGPFQQPYPALVDVDDDEAGTIDAAVEISMARIQGGPSVIVLDDDSGETVQRYLVLDAAWNGLVEGTLLVVSGRNAATVASDASSSRLARAEAMLSFLDYMFIAPATNWLADAAPEIMENDMEPAEFLKNFVASSRGEDLPEATVAAWEGKLPDLLLTLWRRDGFARYRNDRLTLVDPAHYTDVAAGLLRGHALEGVDTFHTYGVTAFGQLLICGENTAVQISIDPHSGQVSADSDAPAPTDAAERSWTLQIMLAFLDGPFLDVTDAQERPLYQHALESLGPLAANEMYSFSPAVAEGGWEAAHVVKRDRLAELHALAGRQ